MNRQKELAKNTIILTVGKICTQFVSFLLLPLYTALLAPDEFGIVDLFNTYITLLIPICNWQIESALFRFVIDYRNETINQKKIFTTVFFTNIFQSIIYIVFYLLFQNYIISEYKIYLALDVVVNIFLNTLLQFSRGIGNNLIYSIASFVSAVSTVILNVIFIACFHWGAHGLFLATLLGKSIALIFLIISLNIWKYLSLNLYDKNLLKDLLKYSLPLVPNQLSWWVIGASDRSIVTKFIGVFSNGIYSVANKISTLYIAFYNIFNLSWTESVSIHMHDEDRDQFLSETINTMFNLFSAIAIGIIACIPFLYDFIINEQYFEAYYQIPILMIAVMFQVIVGLYSAVYVALKKSNEIAKTSFFAAIINILVDLLLIKRIGLYAASISTLLAYASMAFYRYFDVKKYVSISLKFKNIILSLIVCSIVCSTYYLKNYLLCWISLFIAVVYSILINKDFLISVIMEIKSKINYIRTIR